jgi:hypothetical protein
MAIDPRKRQKKLEKQKAKRKEKHQQLVRQKNVGLASQLREAASAPILHCWASGPIFEQGMGQIILSRKLPNGSIAAAVFLVDVYCLGIKNALTKIVSRNEYNSTLRSPRMRTEEQQLEPATARKLIEEAVEYARSLGFSPHPDYQQAKILLGDIDPTESSEEFEFGDKGKPHFIAGPYDNPAKCKAILATLERTVGPGNYDYTLPVSEGEAMELLGDDWPRLQ